ncbi:MAG: aminotransferase class V-fold PLP-dependent enzyme, partial [Bdellovibrionales bacterium]|nr:aminotransferase class V-fold PLP-dependent enzyme [Bdellovibrionales bacterium]
MRRACYCDANATSRLRPEAGAAIRACLSSAHMLGNPSSIHQPGRASRSLVRGARRAVSELLDVSPDSAEIVFTSGGSEAVTAMICGLAGSRFAPGRGSIVTTAIEHDAVLETLSRYAAAGWTVRSIQPNADGFISPDDMCDAVAPDTRLVCVMGANNVLGTIQPVAEIADSLRRSGYREAIVSDCVQLPGKSVRNVGELFRAGVNAASVSSHKLGGPAGVGALLLNRAADCCRLFDPLIVGGPQESRLRAGTENLLGIVGFGAAAEAVQRAGSEAILRL